MQKLLGVNKVALNDLAKRGIASTSSGPCETKQLNDLTADAVPLGVADGPKSLPAIFPLPRQEVRRSFLPVLGSSPTTRRGSWGVDRLESQPRS